MGGPRPAAEPAGFTLTDRPPPLRQLLRDLWRARALIAMLSRRSFFTRYRRASLGLAWAVVLPLVQAVVMAAVFRYAVRINVPHYAVFVFGGLFAWSFFSTAVQAGSTAVVDNSMLSSRIYFPRLVLPIVAVAGNVYNFVATIVILVAAAAVFGVFPGTHSLLLVPAALLTLLTATALSALLSAVHVYFRDIRYIVAAAITAWFYLTPVIYPLRFLTEKHAPAALRVVVQLNPATGLVELFRAAVSGADPSWPVEVAITCAWTIGLAVVAIWVHRRYDRLLTDLL